MSDNQTAYDEFREQINSLQEKIKYRKEEEVKSIQEENNLLLKQLEVVKSEFDKRIEEKNKEIEDLQKECVELVKKSEEHAQKAAEEKSQIEQQNKALKYDNEKMTKSSKKLKEKFKNFAEEKEEEMSALEAKEQALLEKSASQYNTIEEYEERIKQLENLVEHLQSRHVPQLKDAKRDHALTFLEKNNGDKEAPFLALIGTYDEVKKEISGLIKSSRYPRGKSYSITKVPNGITYFNWLRENEHIECDPNDERHFRLSSKSYNRSAEELLKLETPCVDCEMCVDLFADIDGGNESEN